MGRGTAMGVACVLALGWGSAASRAEAPAATADPAREVAGLAGRLEAMAEQVQTLAAEVDRLKKVKLSGYVQARWETAENKRDTVSVSGPGPAIGLANSERFYIRRARVKLAYDSGPRSQAVVCFDGSSSGSNINARLLEAYVTLLDPWTAQRRHAFTIGQMNVPFGFEIERSSSARELPERSRSENVLFPGERDRGVKLVSQWTARIETAFGVFNGTGISNPEYPTGDPTRGKDFVARARYAQGAVDGAVSWWRGRATTALSGPDVETDKTRIGLDVQGYYDLPALGGGTLRAECYGGHDVNPDSVKRLTTIPAAGGRLLRPGADPGHLATDFRGGYVMWVQSLGEQVQAVARYDRHDPDTGAARDRYERVSLGANWFYDAFTRITLSYDIPKTEVAAPGGRFFDPHDNLWTVQVQHRF